MQQAKSSRYLVLYNASGTNLSAAALNTEANGGFFADAKTYWFSTDSKEEADYLTGILNSETVNNAIKPFQSAGSLGERDIHKIPLELPLPRFDPVDKLHIEIATLAGEASRLVGKAATTGKLEGSLVGQRAFAREVAALPLARLDELVKKLLDA